MSRNVWMIISPKNISFFFLKKKKGKRGNIDIGDRAEHLFSLIKYREKQLQVRNNSSICNYFSNFISLLSSVQAKINSKLAANLR